MPQPEAPTAPPEAPAEPQTQQRIIDDDILSSLREDLGIFMDPQPPLPEIKPAAEPAAPAPAPAAPTAIKAKVRTEAPLSRSDVREVVEEVAKQERDKKPEPAAEKFTKDQLRELELAHFAPEAFPDQFPSDFPDRLKAFYKSAAEFAAQRKEQLGRDPGADDEEMLQFIQTNKPRWSVPKDEVKDELLASSRTELRRMKEAVDKLNSRVTETSVAARRAAASPRIEKRTEEFEAELRKELTSDDPFEAAVYDEAITYGRQLSQDLHALSEGVVELDAKNPSHSDILGIMTRETNRIATSSESTKVIGGVEKRFVSPAEFAVMLSNKKDVSKVWTLSTDQMASAVRKEMSSRAKTAIKTEQERLAKHGFVRQKPSQDPKPTQSPTPMAAPMTGRSAAPGATETIESESVMTDGMDVAKTLGLA